MKVDVKCFATLANPDKCDCNKSTAYELKDGQTVEHLIHRVGIKRENVKIAFVNNRVVDIDTELFDGDRVGLTPETPALKGATWFQK